MAFLLKVIQSLKSEKTIIAKFIFLIWFIWKERYDIIFNNVGFNNHKILHKAKFLYNEWTLRTSLDSCYLVGTPFSFHKQPPPTSHHNSIIQVAWAPPPPSHLKRNFDGSVSKTQLLRGLLFTIITMSSFMPPLTI